MNHDDDDDDCRVQTTSSQKDSKRLVTQAPQNSKVASITMQAANRMDNHTSAQEEKNAHTDSSKKSVHEAITTTTTTTTSIKHDEVNDKTETPPTSRPYRDAQGRFLFENIPQHVKVSWGIDGVDWHSSDLDSNNWPYRLFFYQPATFLPEGVRLRTSERARFNPGRDLESPPPVFAPWVVGPDDMYRLGIMGFVPDEDPLAIELPPPTLPLLLIGCPIMAIFWFLLVEPESTLATEESV
eukprot:CAMPEP_0116828760 /NCGR_PEP_ID=MMETSP0418-20121206/3825_1 /TAXON_ID=1158023 /ORGANISM="Astrosyne radiata, Strain 13vi08-1A" /LENGTH=239 /DNA_ID=CAMNT_0004457665 /DNA_START=87 /DNA_END=806 /DNA_ORIENTATION=-